MLTCIFGCIQSFSPHLTSVTYLLENSITVHTELSHPILQEQRWQALQELGHLLSGYSNAYNNTYSCHPSEYSSAIAHAALDRGADRTLCWQLSYTMQSVSVASGLHNHNHSNNNGSSNVSNNHDNVSYRRLSVICECLALLWTRASHDRRKASVEQVPDALPWLLHVWQRFPDIDVSTSVNNNSSSTTTFNILQPVVDILRSWAKIKDSKIKNMLVQSAMIHRLQESLSVGVKAGTTSTEAHDAMVDHTTTSPSPVRLSMLGLIKDLVFRAKDSDKECLYRYLSKVVLAQSSVDTSYSAQEAVSAVLWNWAASETMGRAMAEVGDVWTTLEQYMSLPTTTETIPIHRNASSALGCVVAAWTANSHSYSNPTSSPPPPGLLLEQAWVPARLLKILETETDVDWRRRCMRTIRCFASCDWGRSFLWKYCGSPEYFLNVLVQVLQSDNGGSDTRVQVCQTVSSLLPSAKSGWAPLGPYMETILVQTIQNPASTDKLVLAASHTLHVSLTHSPWKRGNNYSCYPSGFFERISTCLETNSIDASYHIGFSSLLLELASNSTSSADGKSTLVCLSVLSALTVLLSAMGPEYESSRRDALKIITLVMKSDCHKKRLAENEGLLTALVNVCLISSGPLKDEAKHLILRLVPEL